MGKKSRRSEFLRNIAENFKDFAGCEGDKSKGYILIAYDKDANGEMQNAFVGAGHPADLAECMHGCIVRDQTLANITLAAGTAYMQAKAAKFEQANAQAKNTKPAN